MGREQRSHRPHILFQRRWILVLAVLAMLAAPKPGRAEDPAQLKQQGYVSDFAGFISQADSNRIRDVCRRLEEHTGDLILVVTVRTMGSVPQNQFAEQLRKSWVGKPDLRERTLVIVISGQGKMSVSSGSMIDKILTDAMFNAAVHDALSVDGSFHGPKLVYLVQEFAHDLDPNGSLSPPPPAPGAKPAGSATPSSGSMPNFRQRVYLSAFALFGAVLFLVYWFAGPRVRSRVFFSFMFLCIGWVLYAVSSMLGAMGGRILFWFWMFIVVGVAGGLLGAEAQHRSGSRLIGMIFYLPTAFALAAICYVLARLAQARLDS